MQNTSTQKRPQQHLQTSNSEYELYLLKEYSTFSNGNVKTGVDLLIEGLMLFMLVGFMVTAFNQILLH